MTTDTPPNAERVDSLQREREDILSGRRAETWPGERHFLRASNAVLAWGTAVRAQVLPIDGETCEGLRQAENRALDDVFKALRILAVAAGASDPDEQA